MEYMRIGRLREKDFDEIVALCGGQRAVVDYTRSKELNADYLLNEAIIELKLIDEEGLSKENRQKKVAELFRATQPNKPTVVLDANVLDGKSKKIYYNLMEGPVKTHVKKAAKQIDQTQKSLNQTKIRVLLVVNVGYTALDMKEFSSVVLKCARNDTSKIDYVIVAGIYYYSDRFDGFVFTPFELFPINITSPFQSFKTLREFWHKFTEKFMTSFVLGQKQLSSDRLPVIDIRFWHEDKLFVKLAPPFGKPSSFWPEGKRPRENSTGINACPPVAVTFPELNVEQWMQFKDLLPQDHSFQDNYSAWVDWSKREAKRLDSKLKPFVEVAIDFHECQSWCNQHYGQWGFSEVCQYTNTIFDRQVKETIAKAIQKSESNVLVPHYIYLVTEEIGQDMENDLSSIYVVSEVPGFKRKETVFENERLFFEYALALAAAYAVKRKASIVMYDKDQRYQWI
jgi:hypothetical protein